MKNMGYRTLPSLAVGEGAAWVSGPMGPYLGTPLDPKCAHVGLTYDQWVTVLVHRQRNKAGNMAGAEQVTIDKFPAYARALGYDIGYGDMGFDGWGNPDTELDGYGDVCTRTERRYKRKKALLKKKKKQFKRRGRRFLGIRTGDGSKRLATIKRRMKKIRAKAAAKSCLWVGRKKRKKKIAKLEREEKQMEAKLVKEQAKAEKDLEAATAKAVAAAETEAAQPGANPLFILGGVALVGIVMVTLLKKK